MWLTWESWRTVINDQWKEGGEDKCYQGNQDLELNMPVTVTEECLCRNELRQCASLHKAVGLKENTAGVWHTGNIHTTLLFCGLNRVCGLSGKTIQLYSKLGPSVTLYCVIILAFYVCGCVFIAWCQSCVFCCNSVSHRQILQERFPL